MSSLCLLALASSVQVGASTDVVEFRGEELLGTSYYLRAEGTPDALKGIEAMVLSEVERLRLALDRYDSTSELSKLQPGEAQEVSSDLWQVLRLCRTWRIETGGAFDPAVGTLDAVWRLAEESGERPTGAALAIAKQAVSSGRWVLADGIVTPGDLALSLDGLAKGYILDRAVEAAKKSGVPSITFDIGGDIVSSGATVDVQVSDPFAQASNADALTIVRLKDAAIATSGTYARGFKIAGELLGHVINPRTGVPTKHVRQASVVAPLAVDADALATALLVLPVEAGLDLVGRTESTECLLVTEDGQSLRSAGWHALEAQTASAALSGAPKGEPWVEDRWVKLDFRIERPAREAGRRGKSGAYRRPYIAAWVETPAGDSVRTLALWIERERWLRDLRRWYRSHRDDRPLIDLRTTATKKPGEYSLLWDGLGDDGQPLPLGEYTVMLEAAREHGTYQLIKLKIDTREPNARLQAKPNVEIASCSIQFGAQQPD